MMNDRGVIIGYTRLPPGLVATPNSDDLSSNLTNSSGGSGIGRAASFAGDCGGGRATNFNYSQHGIRCPPPAEDPTLVMLRIVAEVYLSMPIAVLGIVGNLLSLVVLCYHRRMQKLHTILIQLQVLAVVDTLILVNVLLLRSLRFVIPDQIYAGYHTAMFPLLYPTMYFLRMFSIWMTVLLTVDRYIAVWYPLDAKRLCTVRRTYLLMLGTAIASAVFTVPRYFEYTLKTYPTGHKGFASTALMSNKLYTICYAIVMFILLQYIVPTFVLVGLNARVIVALRRSDTYRSSVVATPIVRRSMGSLHQPDSTVVTQSVGPTFQSTRSITVVVTAIVSMCVVTHLVALVTHVIWSAQALMSPADKNRIEPLRRHMSQANNVLVTLNSAVNFLVYCVFSRNFRMTLIRRFGMLSPLNFYRRRAVQDGQDSGPCCCQWFRWFCCCDGAKNRKRRRRHSTGCDTGENTGGSKRSTTLLSDSKSIGTATRLTSMPCGARSADVGNGNRNADAGPPHYDQLQQQPSPAVVPCL